MTIFSSSVLGDVQHPINILKEYLTAFDNKCQAAILSWLDNWTRTKISQGKSEWIYLTLEGLASDLGYHKKTVHKHLQELLALKVIERRPVKNKRFPTDTCFEYRLDRENIRKQLDAVGVKYNLTNPKEIAQLFDEISTEEAERLRGMAYESFLKTKYWQNVKKYLYAVRGKQCQQCGKKNRLQVHHTTYKHRGQEHLHLQDLEVLCARCHATEHDLLEEVK